MGSFLYQIKRKKFRRQKRHIQEFIRIAEQQFSDPELPLARDSILLARSTGLSYADVVKLTKEEFLVAVDGKLWIDTYRKKSDELPAVPVFSAAIVLLDMYKTSQEPYKMERVFQPYPIGKSTGI
jgi:hypothetical protein